MQPADKMGHGGVLTWPCCRTPSRHALTGGGLSASLLMPLGVLCESALALDRRGAFGKCTDVDETGG